MSRIALLVSIAVAFVLGGLATLVFLGPIGPRTPGHAVGILAIADADLDSVRVEFASGEPVEIRRGPLADLWLMHEGERVYPVIPARVRALLRLLAEVRTAPADVSSGEPPTASVQLRRRDGRDVILQLMGEPLGGRGLIRVTVDGASVAMLVPDGVHQMFRRASLLAWRSNAGFPAGTGGASRANIRGDGGPEVRLARAGGRWSLVEPFAAPADDRAVAALFEALDRHIVTGFVEAVEESPGGAWIAIETDVRELRGEVVTRRVLVQSLAVVGRGADGEVLARLEGRLREPDGSEAVLWSGVARMRVEGLSSVNARVETYLSPVSCSTPAADVGWIGLGEEGRSRWFRRDLETWLGGRGDSPGSALSTEDAAMVRRVINLLCTTRADRTAPAADVPFDASLEVWLGTPSTEPLARFEVGLIAGADGRTFAAVRAGPVVRLYASTAAFEWLITRTDQ
jgi:hypothetical protein